MLQALLLLYPEVIQLPTSDTPLSNHIANNPKYKTFFTDCVGALDGTHIDIHCRPGDQARYRNRKGHLTQNVLAACNFEMEFKYILAGWEGSAHDGAVYRSGLYKHGFITPPGKYWLGDAGYPNSDTILVPYRGVRYHLKEQRLAGKRPENAKELFNLRHSSRRNVIERIFGVVKRKYQILVTPSEFSIETQTRLFLACFTIHNFVRSMEGENTDDSLETEEHNPVPDIQPVVVYPTDTAVSAKKIDKFRDDLAAKMWDQYQDYLRRGEIDPV